MSTVDFSSLREKLRELDFDTWDVIERAAQNGDAEAQFLMGSKVYFSLGDNRESHRWLRRAAGQGHAEAMYYLAITKFGPDQQVCTRNGGPIGPNRLRRLIRAAERGSSSAQVEWAGYLAVGKFGIEKDWVKARSLFLQAASGGNLNGQISAGWMLIQGEGGPRQLDDGIALLEAVANNENYHHAGRAAAALADVYRAGDDKRNYWQSRETQSRQRWYAKREADRAIRELELAAETGNVEKLRELLAAGVPGDRMDAGWTPLMESASRADLGISRALLEGGADPNKAVKQAVTSRRSTTPDLLLLFLEFGYSPQKLFYEAVWSGRPKDVRVLLDKVDLNEPDASGRFPLVLASLNSAGMVRLLLAHGADPGKIPPDRRHPLILCASRGYLKPLRALLQTWHSDEVLETALVQACSRGRFRCVLALLKAGANVNSSLGTPLMAAADQGSLALVNLLLERGADPDLVDEAGKTARDYALEFTSADFFKKSVEEIGGQPARHRWTTDPVTGEPILQLRVGRQIYRRTNCHKAIVSRFSQVVTGPE